jgi:hypothetical protein
MKTIFIIIAALAMPLLGATQNILSWKSVSELNRPELTWYTLNKNLNPDFETWRAPVGSKEFKKIGTLRRASSDGDTLFFHIIDTTLTVKGLFQYYVKAKDNRDTACYSEVMYGHNLGFLPKPQVISFTATSAKNSKALDLDWKVNYNFTVKALALFRSRSYDKGFELVAILPPDTTHYRDLVPVSNEAYFYFIQIRDFFGYQLPSAVIHGICTYGGKSYPPQNFKASVQLESVALSWKTVGHNVTGYRVYKSMDASGTFRQAGPLVPASDSVVRYTDTAVHAPGLTSARYYAVTVSDSYLESNHTDTLTVPLLWNLAVTPPREVDYTLDSTGLIRLFWTPAGGNSDIMGYNVYLIPSGLTPKKLNASLLPADGNTFLDKESGYGKFEYAVEAVSVAGKPSALRSYVTAERPLKEFHLVVSAQQTGNNIDLTWVNPDLPALDALYFYRQAGDQPAAMRSMVKPDKQTWTDAGILPGESYTYTVVAEYKDGVRILVNDGILVVTR